MITTIDKSIGEYTIKPNDHFLLGGIKSEAHNNLSSQESYVFSH